MAERISYMQIKMIRDNWRYYATSGDHDVYTDPDNNERYIFVNVALPDECYAEIEDNTYGVLQGVRIYHS